MQTVHISHSSVATRTLVSKERLTCHGAIMGRVRAHHFDIISSNCTAEDSGAYCTCTRETDRGENNEGRVGSTGVVGKRGGATFSARLHRE